VEFLLDVNVLIALIDPAHVRHDNAHEWFARIGQNAWATCPVTQNGVLRIVGNPRYPNSPGTPRAVAELMAVLLQHPSHTFWPDSISLLDSQLLHTDRILDSAQITDSYLLALAVANGGHLATFDRKLITEAVIEGSLHLHVIA